MDPQAHDEEYQYADVDPFMEALDDACTVQDLASLLESTDEKDPRQRFVFRKLVQAHVASNDETTSRLRQAEDEVQTLRAAATQSERGAVQTFLAMLSRPWMQSSRPGAEADLEEVINDMWSLQLSKEKEGDLYRKAIDCLRGAPKRISDVPRFYLLRLRFIKTPMDLPSDVWGVIIPFLCYRELAQLGASSAALRCYVWGNGWGMWAHGGKTQRCLQCPEGHPLQKDPKEHDHTHGSLRFFSCGLDKDFVKERQHFLFCSSLACPAKGLRNVSAASVPRRSVLSGRRHMDTPG